jgi:putative intracellular protease/amidase
MSRIVTLLTDGFADWETGLLNAVARSYYKVETHYASPGGKPVTSSGGMKVSPDLALESLDPAGYDVLVICGGTIWQSPEAPDIAPIAKAFHAKGKTLAGICDGTVALARTGLLDAISHTSNGAGYLDKTGYQGKAHYADQPAAVTDNHIITAPATAPVHFMSAVMAELGLADDNLAYYVGLHGAEHGKAA